MRTAFWAAAAFLLGLTLTTRPQGPRRGDRDSSSRRGASSGQEARSRLKGSGRGGQASSLGQGSPRRGAGRCRGGVYPAGSRSPRWRSRGGGSTSPERSERPRSAHSRRR